MPAARKVSSVQLEELVSWMEAHPLLARSTRVASFQAKQTLSSLFEELASRLNAVGDGVTKSAKEWREYWADFKYKVRRKGSQLLQHGRGTGGGPAIHDILNPIEEKVLSLIGVQNMILHPSPLPPPSHRSLKCPPKRKHTTKSPVASRAGKMRHIAGPPRWALDLEERRLHEEETRRKLEERRLALEEARLEEECAFRRLQEQRFEQQQQFQNGMLSLLGRVVDALAAAPRSHNN